MKKTIFTLLMLLVCAIQTTTAYEYFTIYFSDGTKSEAFYATDVDSICYSKLSLDGIAFDDWQVQEIYTIDSVYRYPLAQIDSLSFKVVDENKVAEDIARVMEKTDLILTDDNLEYSLPEIQKIEGVEDVSLGKDRLSIKIRDWGHVYYYYPPKDDSVFNPSSYESVMSRKKASSPGSQSPLRACIVNQIALNQDNDVNYLKGISENVTSALNMVGVVPTYIPIPEPSFFSNNIFDYDIAFIMTHGFYDAETNLHWLLTGKEVLVRNKNGATYDKEKLRQIIQMSNYSPRKIELVGIDEVRDNDTIKVYYLAVSQEFISTGMKISDRQTIVFNTACESLMGAKWKIDEDNNLVNCPDYGLAQAFVKRGANCYLGFDDSNTIGARSGELFLFCLMNGLSLDGAYNILPDSYKFQDYYVYDNEKGQSKIAFKREDGIDYKEEHHPTLHYWTRDASQRIIFPQTLNADIPSDNSQPITLHGSMNYIKFWEQKKEGKVAFSFARIPDPNKFGFLLADNPDMNQAEQLEAEGKYDDSSYTMNFEVSVTKDLQPNTTYYYRAYMNDGYSDCYGEIKQFNTSRSEAYYIVYDDTIKYYYDEMYEQRHGSKGKIEKDYVLSNTLIKKVIFDSSFSNYYPTRFSFEWRDRLEEIVNLQHLRTDSICNMSGMFFKCSSLTNLDLSSFNTSNVTDMGSMFWGCNSLTNLDLSSFNTSNVTDMSGMFYDCNSLMSLDLSSFNTSNVTTMSVMFCGCSSLKSLDLSSFNTTNVTDMDRIFLDCSSLTSLDLSSFITSNVTNMREMFMYCSSLANLDLSSFNTSNVTTIVDMFHSCYSLTTIYAGNWNRGSVKMFDYCYKLVGGQGTKIGQNFYGYDTNGNPLYYRCSSRGDAAHIDGGKDWPGLFTAK